MSAWTEASVVIDAPFDVVWDITNDVARWADLFTEYEQVEVLSEEPDRVTFRLTMHPDENGIRWSWVSERVHDRTARTVRARRIETGPFEYMYIVWTYDQVPGGTRMTWVQDFAMKPTAPVDDATMAAGIRKNSPIQMAAIRERIEATVRAAA